MQGKDKAPPSAGHQRTGVDIALLGEKEALLASPGNGTSPM